jgi:pimeloyl-ACP methyl ester carboxylesterase
MTKIKIPTLIIWGDRDLILSISEGKLLSQIIPKSVFRVVWGADHWPHLSRQKEFLEIINDYL